MNSMVLRLRNKKTNPNLAYERYQQIKHVNQRLKYAYEKGLNRGKTCEVSKPNNKRNLNQGFLANAYVPNQRPAYTGFNLPMHAYGMCAWDLFKTLTQKHDIEKQSIKENLNSNNLASNKHKTKQSKHVITQTKHEKYIKQQKKD